MPHRPPLCLVPLDPVDPEILRHLGEAINGLLCLPVEIAPPQPLPLHTLHPGRNQYHSTKLLEYLLSAHPEPLLILGITGVDLYIPIFTFVFGEAQLSGRAAIISLFRPGGGADGVRPPRAVLLERLLKLSVHELGHTLGLGHCRQAGCLMNFSSNLEKLDRTKTAFCQYCRVLLADAFKDYEPYPPQG